MRNKKTSYGGYIYDSKLEAGVARELDLKMRAGEIEHWERQFKIEMVPCDSTGRPIPKLKIVHYVDFRQHNLDGTFTLVEAKGFETAIWRMKRKWLEALWLPDHPDHDYIVIKSAKRWGLK